jgi:hypothetical protein
MLSNKIISDLNDKIEVQKSLNSDFIFQLNEINNNYQEMMNEIIRFFNDEIMINIEDIFSIIDIINRNNNKINNKIHLELENHKIIINDLSLKLDKFKISINSIILNNDTNKNILRSISEKIEKIEENENNNYYIIVNLCITGIVIYINFLYIYIK